MSNYQKNVEVNLFNTYGVLNKFKSKDKKERYI